MGKLTPIFRPRTARRLGLRYHLMALSLAAGIGGAALAAPDDAKTGEEAAPFAYGVEITSLVDEEARTRVLAASEVWAKRREGAGSLFALEARLRRDEIALAKLLRGLAYYEAEVKGEVREGAGGQRIAVLAIAPGARYRFGRVSLLFDEPGVIAPPLPPHEGPATGRAVLALEREVVERLKAEGRSDAAFLSRRAVMRRETGTLDIEIRLHAGPVTYVGSIEVAGAEKVRNEAIVKHSGLRIGERIVPATFRDAEEALRDLSVFETIEIAARAGEAPHLRRIRIIVRERKHRTIGAGLNWQSSEGAGGRVYWEHRNLLQGAERLRIDGQVADRLSELALAYRQKAAVRLDRVYLASASLASEETDAFDLTRAGLGVSAEQRLQRYTRGKVGLTAEWERSDDGTRERDAFLLGAPLAFSYDDTDRLLDPRRGVRAALGIGPYVGGSAGELGFTTLQVAAATYRSFEVPGTPTLAARVRLGATLGPAGSEIPPGKRFFSGGGGSVRGYAFQSVGPRDAQGDPIGGKSVLEGSFEVRTRLYRGFGLAAFGDAGSAFEETLPLTSDRVLTSAGLGLLYETPVGPIRLDIAVPISRREDDDPFQVYFSIGQAF